MDLRFPHRKTPEENGDTNTIMFRMLTRKLFFTLLAFSTVISCTELIYPQSTRDAEALPQNFSRFSEKDILAAVFSDFDRSTGRVPHVRNEQKQPSLVRLNQARLWKSGGQDYLVVIVDIAGYDEQFEDSGLCGNCTTVSPLAVLRAVDHRLELVAKQDEKFFRSEGGPNRDYGLTPLTYNGHDFDVSLDLAPYRLNHQETLIGVRYQHMWIPANSFSTTLLLYRVEGNRIREVFSDLVVARDWVNGPAERLKMEKTNSVIISRPSKGPFNEFVAVRKTYQCIADWDTYDCTGGTLIRTKRETWQFDGTRFVIKQPE